jgi:hypothetical protein
MLMSTLMATVRSVRVDLGVAVPLPFLPIEDLDGVPDLDPSSLCRAVEGMGRENTIINSASFVTSYGVAFVHAS